MVPAPRPRFDVRCIRTSGTQAPCVSTRGKRRCVLARVAITSVCYCGGILAAVLLLGFALRVALLCPCVAVMAAMLRVPARACVRTLARVCCMCNLAPAPSVTRIKLWSSRSRHDMTPAERRLQKNGHNVRAIGACAMTWSGMPLSRGSGHFCTCGERRAAKYRDAHDACGCRLHKYNSVRAWCMGNDSCEHADSCGVPERALCACGVLWAADIGMGMLLKDTYVRPATCGFQHLREPGCALWGSSCKLPKSSVTASSGRLEMPCECASRPHIHARACTWHAIVQTEVRTVLALALGSALGLRHLRGFDLAGLGLADRCHHRWRVGCARSAFELKRQGESLRILENP